MPDIDGYPTDEELNRIQEFKIKSKKDCIHLMDYIEDLWKYNDWGWEEDKENHIFYISTGGWSGNEDLISYMKKNFIFWSLMFRNYRIGGHYILSPNSLKIEMIVSLEK